MKLKKDDDTEQKIRAVLNGLTQPRQSNSEVPNIGVSYRYGLSLLLIAVFTLIAGAFPLPTEPINRVILLGYAVLLLFIGIWNIDRALTAQRASVNLNKKGSE